MSLFVQQPKVNSFQLNIGSGEDRYLISDDIYAVFDGHGGNIVSDILSKKMVEFLKPKLDSIDISNNDEITDTVTSAFKELDEYVLQLTYYRVRCGSTCSLVIKLDKKLVLVNLGDSNVILFVNGEKYCEMPQHLYSNPEEKSRIDSLIESGGVFIKPGFAPKVISSEDIIMKVSKYIGLDSTNEKIVPTKNFGHVTWKKEGKMDVIPYIQIIDILDENIYECIIASDGILDMIVDTEELQQFLAAENQSQKIVEFADSRWKQKWRYNVNDVSIIPDQQIPNPDDMTVVYAKF